MSLTKEEKEHWGKLLDKMSPQVCDREMTDEERLLALQAIADAASALGMSVPEDKEAALGDIDLDELNLHLELDEDDFRLATSEDFRQADEEEKNREITRRVVEDIEKINREFMEKKAKNRIGFGKWVAKKCRKYPKSTWWLVAWAMIGIGTGNLFGGFGTGIMLLVIAHLVKRW